jgi:hypothetical protein
MIPVTNRLGDAHKTDPVYAVSNLGSLFSVCACALDGASYYRDDIKSRAIEDVRLVLELAAALAADVAEAVETRGGYKNGGSIREAAE